MVWNEMQLLVVPRIDAVHELQREQSLGLDCETVMLIALREFP